MLRLVLLVLMSTVNLVSSLDQVRDAGRDAWPIAARPVRSQWCCEHIKLPSETSAQPGRYSLRGREYLQEIIDAVDDPEVRELTFIGASQIGKTLFTKAVILSQGEVGRAPMMFAGPDQLYTREAREDIYKMAEVCDALKGRIPPKRFRNDRSIDLERCLVYLAWSGSTQRLSGRSCKIVLCSEADRWQLKKGTSGILLAKERVKAFPDNYTIVLEGTPIDASPVLDESYHQSDRRRFLVPCPHCGHRQELRFFPHRDGDFAGNGGVAGLKDGRGDFIKPDQARLLAYYLCERGCRIESNEKPAMIAAGRWVREGQTLDPKGQISGTPKNPGRHAGFRVSSLYAPTLDFGTIGEKYLQLRDQHDGMKRFFNDWLGLKWEPRGKTPKWQDLGARLAGPVPRGVVPRAAWFLTCGCDVQERGVYWVVRAWGDQKTSWLVDWGYIPKPLAMPDIDVDDPDAWSPEILAGDLAQLDAQLLQRAFPVDGQNPRGLSSLPIRVLLVDRGYRQKDVDAFVRRHPGTRVFAVAGDPKITAGELWRPHSIERDPKTGERLEHAAFYWGIETNAYKSEIADRWQADQRQGGCWWLTSDILTTAGGEDYLRQITAETRVYEAVHGRKRTMWQLISHGLPNHLWDCEVYASFGADQVVGQQWDASQWPKTAAPRRNAEGEEAVRVREIANDFSAR